jgi:hypothetical protein
MLFFQILNDLNLNLKSVSRGVQAVAISGYWLKLLTETANRNHSV